MQLSDDAFRKKIAGRPVRRDTSRQHDLERADLWQTLRSPEQRKVGRHCTLCQLGDGKAGSGHRQQARQAGTLIGGAIRNLSGEVSVAFDPLLVPMPHVKSGKINVLAVASAKRWPGEPNIPTMEESGFPGFVMSSWTGLLAPAGTPRRWLTAWRRKLPPQRAARTWQRN